MQKYFLPAFLLIQSAFSVLDIAAIIGSEPYALHVRESASPVSDLVKLLDRFAVISPEDQARFARVRGEKIIDILPFSSRKRSTLEIPATHPDWKLKSTLTELWEASSVETDDFIHKTVVPLFIAVMQAEFVYPYDSLSGDVPMWTFLIRELFYHSVFFMKAHPKEGSSEDFRISSKCILNILLHPFNHPEAPIAGAATKWHHSNDITLKRTKQVMAFSRLAKIALAGVLQGLGSISDLVMREYSQGTSSALHSLKFLVLEKYTGIIAGPELLDLPDAISAMAEEQLSDFLSRISAISTDDPQAIICLVNEVEEATVALGHEIVDSGLISLLISST